MMDLKIETFQYSDFEYYVKTEFGLVPNETEMRKNFVLVLRHMANRYERDKHLTWPDKIVVEINVDKLDANVMLTAYEHDPEE